MFEKVHIALSSSIKFLVNMWNDGKKLEDLRCQIHWKHWMGVTFGRLIRIFWT